MLDKLAMYTVAIVGTPVLIVILSAQWLTVWALGCTVGLFGTRRQKAWLNKIVGAGP